MWPKNVFFTKKLALLSQNHKEDSAQKEMNNNKKKLQSVKREKAESIIFTAQFLSFSRTGELNDRF